MYVFDRIRVKIAFLPKKVLQMYSEIWFPDFDSEKWLSSLFSIRLNCKIKITIRNYFNKSADTRKVFCTAKNSQFLAILAILATLAILAILTQIT